MTAVDVAAWAWRCRCSLAARFTRRWSAAREASFDLFEQQAAADAGYRKIYEQWKQDKEISDHWFNTAEVDYTRFAWRADA